MGMPLALQAAMTSSSFFEPPGWMMAVTPAAAACFDRVGEGEEGVGGQHRAGRPVAGLFDGDFGRIDAAHLARARAQQHAVLGKHDGVRLDVPHDLPGEAQIGHLRRRGLCFGDDLPERLRDRAGRRPLASARRRRGSGRSSAAATGPSWPTSISRTLAFHLGLVVRISSASLSKSGATMASTNRPGAASTSAVAASTVRFSPSTEPNALSGSPSIARCKAAASVSATAAPQGLLCLITTAAGSEKLRTMPSALSRSSRLL